MKGHKAIACCSFCNTQGQICGKRMFMSLRHECVPLMLQRTNEQVLKEAEQAENLLKQHQYEGKKSTPPSVNGFYSKTRLLLLTGYSFIEMQVSWLFSY
jgi:hypothetical protein